MIQSFATFILAQVGPQLEVHEHPLRKMRLKRYRKPYVRSRYKGGSKRERLCRRILQSLTPGIEWASCRPRWLIGEHGRKLELDCWAPALGKKGIAVEVQGIHHNNSSYIGEEEFEKQRRRDIIKRQILRNRGVPLIEVPHTIEDADLDAYLCIQLSKCL